MHIISEMKEKERREAKFFQDKKSCRYTSYYFLRYLAICIVNKICTILTRNIIDAHIVFASIFSLTPYVFGH